MHDRHQASVAGSCPVFATCTEQVQGSFMWGARGASPIHGPFWDFEHGHTCGARQRESKKGLLLRRTSRSPDRDGGHNVLVRSVSSFLYVHLCFAVSLELRMCQIDCLTCPLWHILPITRTMNNC